MPASAPTERAVAAGPGFAVYVHWPFCLAKCPYCDFNSHVREGVEHARWRRALLAELAHEAARTPGRPVRSVFFGGGTPSLMQPETVAAVLEAIDRHWGFEPDAEVTLEANPTSVEAGRFAAYRQAGVGRLSLGVQALDDAALKALGRAHDRRQALAALELALATFPRASFDLIYARPGQDEAAWRGELAQALAFGTRHLSLYQLTVEEGTAFHNAWKRGRLALPDEDTQAALWEATQELTAAAGLAAYEVSNHAAPGEASRHNLVYWRYGEYAGVGPGAHGRPGRGEARRATAALKRPEAWLEAVEAAGHGREQDEAVPAEERFREMAMLGLRLAEGLDLAGVEAETGRSFAGWVEAARWRPLVEDGFLALAGGRLAATAAGRPVLNALLRQLLA